MMKQGHSYSKQCACESCKQVTRCFLPLEPDTIDEAAYTPKPGKRVLEPIDFTVAPQSEPVVIQVDFVARRRVG